MNAFELTNLIEAHQQSGKAYLEFLRQPSLSMGVYHLPAGEIDPQQPHTEDEVYYVASGRAQITVGAENRSVGPGSIVSVAANVEHRFHTVEEELTVLVFFAPAEYTQRGDADITI